jgi:hypothetical protein
MDAAIVIAAKCLTMTNPQDDATARTTIAHIARLECCKTEAQRRQRQRRDDCGVGCRNRALQGPKRQKRQGRNLSDKWVFYLSWVEIDEKVLLSFGPML